MYDEDLAFIHHRGFGDLALKAAPGIASLLEEAGLAGGLVADLGCGDGGLLRELAEAGFRVWGVDSSRELIRVARENAQAAELHVASLLEVELPACAAVTAIGEVLSYLPGGMPELSAVVNRVAAALSDGGLFIFDLIETAPAEPMNYRSWSAGEDWAVLADVSEDVERRRIDRRITTFRRIGDLYRRGEETHRVWVCDRSRVGQLLKGAGFETRTARSYGDEPLAHRRVAFVCTRDRAGRRPSRHVDADTLAEAGERGGSTTVS